MVTVVISGIVSEMQRLIWLKIAYFPTPLIRHPRSPPLEFFSEGNHEVTSHGAILQWRPRDRSVSHIDTVPACDGRTDGQINSIASTVFCLASSADAL